MLPVKQALSVRTSLMSMLGLYLVVGIAAESSGDWQKLDGSFAITGERYGSSPSEDSQDAHMRIRLRGETAKSLYERMPIEPTVDVCTDGQSKKIQGMQCLFYPWSGEYECAFSIDITKQVIEGGFVC